MFQKDIVNFVNSIRVENYDDEYWIAVVEGIEILFKYKSSFFRVEEFIQEFMQAREIINEHNESMYKNDIMDELNAVLITYYPMPDFWKSTIDDFRKHSNFKKYFDKLDEKRKNG